MPVIKIKTGPLACGSQCDSRMTKQCILWLKMFDIPNWEGIYFVAEKCLYVKLRGQVKLPLGLILAKYIQASYGRSD